MVDPVNLHYRTMRKERGIAIPSETPYARRVVKMRTRFAGRYEAELAKTEEKARILREIIDEQR